jgi:hypothetical protein
MYKELFVIEPDLTQILSSTYNDIIQVNKWLVLYFQQRRKKSSLTDFGYVLTELSVDRTIRHNMEAAQIKIFRCHRSHGISP